jgi:hypothetical protein
MLGLGFRREGVAVLRDLIANGGFNGVTRNKIERMIRGEEDPVNNDRIGPKADEPDCAVQFLRQAVESGGDPG